MDAPWDDGSERVERPGWLNRLSTAVGRLFGRRSSALAVLDTREAGPSQDASDRTRPIDTRDLEPAEAPRRSAAHAAVKPPPPLPRAATSPGMRALTSPGLRA